MTMMASIFTAPFLIERAFGLPKTFTAALLLALQATWVVMAYVSGWIYDRYQARWLIPLGMGLIAIGLFGMGLLAEYGYVPLVAAALVLGVGTGLYMTANNTLAVTLLPASKRGLASGVLETTRQLGHTMGVAIPVAMMGPAVTAASGGAAAGFLQGFREVSLAMAGLCVVGFALSLLPLQRRRPDSPRPVATPEPAASGRS
jgi:MFS family permease